MWEIKVTTWHAMLLLHMTAAATADSTMQGDGTGKRRHTSVSCSHKVCLDAGTM